jgi:hypothetical protein
LHVNHRLKGVLLADQVDLGKPIIGFYHGQATEQSL